MTAREEVEQLIEVWGLMAPEGLSEGQLKTLTLQLAEIREWRRRLVNLLEEIDNVESDTP